MTKEPKRLIESDTGPLAQSLAAAQLRLPSEARMAALAARLAGTGIVLAEPPERPALRELTRASSVVPAKALELSHKMVIASVALGVVALGGALAWRYGTPHHPANPAPLTLAAPPALTPPAPGAANVASPTPSPALAKAPRALPPPAAADRESPESAPAEVAAEQTERAVSDEVAQAPRAATPSPGSAASPAHARNVEPEPKRATLSAPQAKSGAATSSGERLPLPANTVVDSEVETLKKARNALSGDPVQAFALTERCRAQYPNGGFAQERDFIAISALIRMGRSDEARNRASLFRTRYRNSAYLPQLTRMLGEE